MKIPTPEERFDRTWATYLGQTFSYEDEARDWLRQHFAAEIREAVDEIKEQKLMWAAKEIDMAYCRGLEDAAKIAEENCLGSNTHATNEACPTAYEIRARAKEIKG